MAFVLKYDESELNKKIDGLGPKVSAAVLMYATTKAPIIESRMKIGRPWRDRTGIAKATLAASVSKPGPEIIRITLSHGVDYGLWLELANEGNYAIIIPSIKKEGPEFIKDMEGLMNKLGI